MPLVALYYNHVGEIEVLTGFLSFFGGWRGFVLGGGKAGEDE
jgi:hypothetical protein